MERIHQIANKTLEKPGAPLRKSADWGIAGAAGSQASPQQTGLDSCSPLFLSASVSFLNTVFLILRGPSRGAQLLVYPRLKTCPSLVGDLEGCTWMAQQVSSLRERQRLDAPRGRGHGGRGRATLSEKGIREGFWDSV